MILDILAAKSRQRKCITCTRRGTTGRMLVVLLVIVALQGCESPDAQDWRYRQSIDTRWAYEGFIERYPTSKYRGAAEAARDRLIEQEERNDPKIVIEELMAQKPDCLYKDTGIGRSLLRLGARAIAELTVALEAAPREDRGCLARALGFFGPDAKAAVPKLVELFPIVPTEEFAIPIKRGPERWQPSSQELDDLFKKYGKGRVIEQAKGNLYSPENTIRWIYAYTVEAPVAAKALYDITGACPGIRQEDWREWLRTEAVTAGTK